MEDYILLSIICVAIYVISEIISIKRYKETAYYKQTKLPLRKLRQDIGKFGEYYTYKYLNKIQGHKKFLFNVYIPKKENETTEIDILMIHNTGIYVFESKNYSGWIFGKEDQRTWTQSLPTKGKKTKKEKFLNPIIQNKTHIKYLKELLNEEKYNYFSYIVFSERCELKNITITSGEHPVIKRNVLLDHIEKHISQAEQNLTDEEIDALYNQLYQYTQVSEEVKTQHIQAIQDKKK